MQFYRLLPLPTAAENHQDRVRQNEAFARNTANTFCLQYSENKAVFSSAFVQFLGI